MPRTQETQVPLRVGISACLLGRRVRFDGGHKRDGFLVDTFGRFVEWVPVCPEVELGLGTPRETLRLVRSAAGLRLVMPKSDTDHTRPMSSYATRRARELVKQGLSGFILKKDSPSCGMERVRVYDKNGVASKSGRGLFAEALMRQLPNLPVEEEGRLNDMRLRENFVERVFAYQRLRGLLSGRLSVGRLVAFHTRNKLLLMAHSPQAYKALGRMVASAKSLPTSTLRAQYESGFMKALRTVATPRRHANVLQHMIGYFSDSLDSGERQELVELIDDHRRGLLPLIVPLTLVRHHVKRFHVEYLAEQTYLQPHPKELMLRNHV